MWWKPSPLSLVEWLKPFDGDNDVLELAEYVVLHNCEIDIYIEHSVTESSTVDFIGGLLEGNVVPEIDEVPQIDDVPLSADLESDIESEVEIDDREMPTNYGQVNDIDDAYISEELQSDFDSDCDLQVTKSHVKFNPNDMSADFKFKVGMQFSSLQLFKEAIMEFHVMIGRTIKYVKNYTKRVRVKCKQNCGYTVLCSKVANCETYEVKTIEHNIHTCGRVFNNKNAKAKWVARVIVDKLKSNSKLTLNEIVEELQSKYATGIKMCTAEKARNLARVVIEGDSSKQYSLLSSYSAELRRIAAGNTCKLQLDRPRVDILPRFQRFYMCLEGCRKAFASACRPFIGVDGCHLKTKYGGILLAAVGRDPNDQYLPLAFAVVEAETKDSWRWFMTLLLEDLRDENRNRFVFISDQQKGLLPAFEDLLVGSEHRFCLRHLYNNFKKKFGGGTFIRDIMMGAAKATYHQHWEEKMNQLKEINEQAYDWLAAIPKQHWCKHAFSYYAKCDVLMNNLTESFNATILLAREKPILTMLEWIRTYMMNRFASLNEKGDNYEGIIMPKPMKRLNREVQFSGNWFAKQSGEQSGEYTFEVTHITFTNRFIVDLERLSCSWNFWELVGIPCRHVVVAILVKVKELIDYMHKYYHIDTYKLCYRNMISALNGQKMWTRTNDPDILPPIYKRGAGRPKKLRRREQDEPVNSTKLRRSQTTNICSRCQMLGHNTRTCKVPVLEQEPVRDVEVTDEPTPTQLQETDADVTHETAPAEAAQAKAVHIDAEVTHVSAQIAAAPIVASQQSQTTSVITNQEKSATSGNHKRKIPTPKKPVIAKTKAPKKMRKLNMDEESGQTSNIEQVE